MKISVVALSVLCACSLPGRAADGGTTLFAFSGIASEPKWVVVNDGVMGGVSSSTVTTKNGVMRFAGRVRLENNGGFASSRSINRYPRLRTPTLANASAFTMRIRSSGSPFNVTVETERRVVLGHRAARRSPVDDSSRSLRAVRSEIPLRRRHRRVTLWWSKQSVESGYSLPTNGPRTSLLRSTKSARLAETCM